MRLELFAAVCAVALPLGCVYPDYREAGEAKEAYEECVREHGPEHRDCEVLWETYQVKLERYEDNARIRWSCDPTQEECPTKR